MKNEPSEPQSIKIFIPEIQGMIAQKQFEDLKVLLSELNSIDIADGFSYFPPEQQVLVFKLLDSDRAVEVFSELSIGQQEYLLNHLEDQTITPLLEGIPVDSTASLFRAIPERHKRRMIHLMKKEKVASIESVLQFPPGTVGTVMQTELIPIGPDMTARAALERLQSSTRIRQKKPVHTYYVCNGNNRLVGGLTLETLIAAPASMKIRDLMSPVQLIKISAHTSQEDAAKIFSRYKLISAPVVNEFNQLVGILTADDMIEVLQNVDTEDIQKMGGVEHFDQPYFVIPFLKMIEKRATWLCVLFIGEMLTATAMGFFEKEIARAVVLALFIPLIISSGGNSGSQAATLIVRAMALKEISFEDWWRVLRREFFSGIVLGSILGAIGFLRIFLWSRVSGIYGPHPLQIASTVGASLVLVVLWGTLSGSLLPILLKKLKFDPAVVSAPLVATLVDVTGLVIYFSVGMFFLSGTIL